MPLKNCQAHHKTVIVPSPPCPSLMLTQSVSHLGRCGSLPTAHLASSILFLALRIPDYRQNYIPCTHILEIIIQVESLANLPLSRPSSFNSPHSSLPHTCGPDILSISEAPTVFSQTDWSGLPVHVINPSFFFPAPLTGLAQFDREISPTTALIYTSGIAWIILLFYPSPPLQIREHWRQVLHFI